PLSHEWNSWLLKWPILKTQNPRLKTQFSILKTQDFTYLYAEAQAPC
ncbi:MAG: hypothetical protein ACI93E_001353, partial [Flavobacteriales bacterium]